MITKICGIKSKETLICCEELNVNFFGMIFYSKSPRNISIDNALELQKFSKKFKINGVGVFVDLDLNVLKKYISQLELNFVQLHGNEDERYINDLKKSGVEVIKKISISNSLDLDILEQYNNADYFLFDYKPDKNELPGGNAKSFDWNFVRDLKINKPWFLSGGVNINNIQYIKSEINPHGVDLSSGVEKKLGIKDNQTINNFMDKINNA